MLYFIPVLIMEYFNIMFMTCYRSVCDDKTEILLNVVLNTITLIL
jgi:hypothetical protein